MSELRRYRIRGRVQGVGFRAFVWRQARELGVTGWVRNRFDGSVEALAAAPPETHALLLAELERGPRMSLVERVDVEEVEEPTETFSSFEVRYDA
jgi:acylphosphatase